VRAVQEETGALIEAEDYDAWGVLMAGRSYLSGVGAKEGYTGKERDAETGLDYFGARYYLGAIGRWGGVDALTDQYPSWSPYTYVLNSPLRLVDPRGLDTWAVHGTYSSASSGWCPPSQESCSAGESYAALWQEFLEDDGDLHLFEWGDPNIIFPDLEKDNNHHVSRVEAAIRLVLEILQAYNENPEMAINIIGHSHGGNVAIIAANILYEVYGIQLDNLVVLGTPQRDEYSLIPDAAKNFVSVFNYLDVVQTSGGNITESLYYLPSIGEIGPARRIQPLATNLNVSPWIPSTTLPWTAHGMMHRSTVVMYEVSRLIHGDR
jgi:RHS repeat-associated protein